MRMQWTKWALVLAAGGSLGGCASWRTPAPRPDDRVAERLAAIEEKLADLDARLQTNVEERFARLETQDRAFAARLDEFQRAARRLELDLALWRQEQDAFRKAVLSDLAHPGAGGQPLAVAVPGAPAATDEGEPDLAKISAGDLYRRGFDSLVQENYGDAIEAFKIFLTKYPSHEFADEAQFRLGESYFALKDYSKALIAFGKVAKDFPDEPRAPDAQFEVSRCYAAMGNKKRARAALRELIERYPASAAAGRAKSALEGAAGASGTAPQAAPPPAPKDGAARPAGAKVGQGARAVQSGGTSNARN